jgi:hypothetical protein
MSIEQTANALAFYAFYAAEGVGKTGLTVTVDVYRGATQIVTGAAATAIGGGLYSYTLAAGSTGTEGEYIAVFKTTDLTVDARHIPALWTVGRGGVEMLDSLISSRAVQGSTVLVASPVTADGNAAIRQGKDYVNAIGTALGWTLSNPPASAPTAVTFTCAALGFSKTATYAAGTITLQLTAAETAAMRAGSFAFELEATFSGGGKSTLLAGTLSVEKDV